MKGYNINPPAGAILERVAPTLLRLWTEDEIAVSGGAALAAHWNHRLNTDIDITVPLTAFRRAGNRIAESLAGSFIMGPRHGRFWLSGFCEEGDFNVTAAEPWLPPEADPPDREMRFGIRFESTAEILACGLRHRMYGYGEFVSRDFYDLCAAAESAPAALDRALSLLDIEKRRELVREISVIGPKAATLGQPLKNVHRPEWLDDLGRRTADLIAAGLAPTHHTREEGTRIEGAVCDMPG